MLDVGFESAESGDELDGPKMPKQMSVKCTGTNRKGKTCKAFALANSKFCSVHMPADASFAVRQHERREQQEALPPPLNPGEASVPQNGTVQPVVHPDGVPLASEPLPNPESLLPPGLAQEDLAAADDRLSECSDAAVLDVADAGRYDNPDEIEEGDHLQHLREVYQVDDEDSDKSDGSSSESDGGVGSPIDAGFAADAGWRPQERREKRSDPWEWTWDMSFEERWDACQDLMAAQKELLHQVAENVKTQMPVARKALQDAKVRASARVYEN